MLLPARLRPSGPVARWAGAGFVLATGALLAVTVALDLSTDPDGVGARLAPGWGWSYASLGPLLAGLATVILVRDPRQGFGWALAWLSSFWSLDGLSQSFVRWSIRADQALTGANLALWFLNRAGAFLPFTVALLLLLFPDGRFLPGRWRIGSWVATVVMALAGTLVVVAPAHDLPAVPLPAGVDLDVGALPLPDAVTSVALGLTLVSTVAGLLFAMVTVAVRHRRSRGLER